MKAQAAVGVRAGRPAPARVPVCREGKVEYVSHGNYIQIVPFFPFHIYHFTVYISTIFNFASFLKLLDCFPFSKAWLADQSNCPDAVSIPPPPFSLQHLWMSAGILVKS